MILFELSNTLASFKSYINKILAGKLDIFVIVYINNILIKNNDLSLTQVNIIQQCLDVLKKYDLFANLKNYEFYKDKVYFSNYIILAKKVKIETKRSKK